MMCDFSNISYMVFIYPAPRGSGYTGLYTPASADDHDDDDGDAAIRSLYGPGRPLARPVRSENIVVTLNVASVIFDG